MNEEEKIFTTKKAEEGSNKGEDNLVAIRTFKSDAESYVSRRGVSSVDVLAAQSRADKKRGYYDSHEITGKLKEKKSRKLLIISIAGLILIAGGYFAYSRFLRPAETPSDIVIKITKPFIIPDRAVEANLDNYLTTAGSNGQVNTLLYIPITETVGLEKHHIASDKFLGSLNPIPPASLVESLDTQFMLAEFYFSQDSPALIFKVKIYPRTVSGMFTWEKNMGASLAKIFGEGPQDGIFKDKTIDGLDARILFDKNNKPFLIYSFIEKGNYLVITRTEEGFREIIRRFTYPEYRNI